jgi:hypothetical protein
VRLVVFCFSPIMDCMYECSVVVSSSCVVVFNISIRSSLSENADLLTDEEPVAPVVKKRRRKTTTPVRLHVVAGAFASRSSLSSCLLLLSSDLLAVLNVIRGR